MFFINYILISSKEVWHHMSIDFWIKTADQEFYLQTVENNLDVKY